MDSNPLRQIMTSMKTIFLNFLLTASVVMAVPRVIRSQPQDPASVEGTVVQAGTSTPLPRTRVVLNSQDGRILSPLPNGVKGVSITMTATTDENGRFAFSNLPPGSYSMIATHDGFVRSAFGDAARTESGKGFRLAPKQELKNAVISMTPTGTISGRIKNKFGEPMGNVEVQAHRYVYEGGRRALNAVLTVLTNDLGEYRLYYLEPGQYIVTAVPPTPPTAGRHGEIYVGNFATLPGSPLAGKRDIDRTITSEALAAAGVVGPAETGETYLPVFFPGTTDPSAANPIDLHAGATLNAIDFTVNGVRAAHVRGKVTNIPTAQNASDVSVILMSEITGYSFWLKEQSTTVSDSGAFEFRGVPPGSYQLVATLGDLPSDITFPGSGYPGGALLETYHVPIPPDNRPRGVRLVTKTSIEVSDKDVSNIALALGPGYKMDGKISIEGRSGPEAEAMIAGIKIQLVPDPETFESAPLPAKVGPSGAFTITGLVPGTYQIAITDAENVPDETYVKSVLLDNTDAINPRLVITGEPRGPMEIVLGTTTGQVEVKVTNAKQDPVAGARVVLVPDLARRQHFDLYQVQTTLERGEVGFGGLPPGDYQAFAWESVEDGAWWDPAFLQRYDGLGKAVHVTAGAPQTIDLTLLPPH